MRPQSSTATWRTRRDPPRLGVDLDDGDVRAEREGGAVLAESSARGEVRRRARHLRPGDGRGRHAAHAELAVVGELDVVDGRLQQLRRPLAGLLEHVAGRGVHGAAAELQRPRSAGAPAARHERGVGLDERDLVERDAEPVARRASRTPSAWPWPCPDVPAAMVAVPSACTVTEPYSSAAARRDLDVDADPDAELHAVARRPPGGLLRAQPVVAGDLAVPPAADGRSRRRRR